MRKLTYYAVFEPSTNGSYGVFWPDLPGCVSMGDDLPHALRMASEALGLHYTAWSGMATPCRSSPCRRLRICRRAES
jgi:predicted RNase H-like HicB family nuclease